MLPSEFFERTGVDLTGEDYAKVEKIYESVQMNKDDFCRLWLENRDNQIINELMVTISGLETDNQALKKANEILASNEKVMKDEYERNLDVATNTFQDNMFRLAHKILADLGDESRLYDIIEEEFSLDFIIKWKLKENYDLLPHEREHLLKKL